MIINKHGKSKQQLLDCLEKLKSKSASEISQYNVSITQTEDGYRIQGGKKVLLMNFVVDVNIIAKDGEFVIDYETKNVPKSKVDEAIEKVKQVLENC